MSGMKDHQIDLEELIAEADLREAREAPSWLDDAMAFESQPPPAADQDDTINIEISPDVLKMMALFGISREEIIEKVAEVVRSS